MIRNMCTRLITLGSGALPGKMLLVSIIENNKIINANFRSGLVN